MKLVKLNKNKEIINPKKVVEKFDFLLNRANVESINNTNKKFPRNTIGDCIFTIIPNFVFNSDLKYCIKSIKLNTDLELTFNRSKKRATLNTEKVINVELDSFTLNGNGKLL